MQRNIHIITNKNFKSKKKKLVRQDLKLEDDSIDENDRIVSIDLSATRRLYFLLDRPQVILTPSQSKSVKRSKTKNRGTPFSIIKLYKADNTDSNSQESYYYLSALNDLEHKNSHKVKTDISIYYYASAAQKYFAFIIKDGQRYLKIADLQNRIETMINEFKISSDNKQHTDKTLNKLLSQTLNGLITEVVTGKWISEYLCRRKVKCDMQIRNHYQSLDSKIQPNRLLSNVDCDKKIILPNNLNEENNDTMTVQNSLLENTAKEIAKKCPRPFNSHLIQTDTNQIKLPFIIRVNRSETTNFARQRTNIFTLPIQSAEDSNEIYSENSLSEDESPSKKIKTI